MPTPFPNLPPRDQWTFQDYQTALRKLRQKATSLRRRAADKDAEAEQLRREFAARATHKLPLFEDGKDSHISQPCSV